MTSTTAAGARIFLTDDHPAVLEGLSMLLSLERHVICGVASSRAELLERLDDSGADIVLVDLGLCDESGLDIIPQVCDRGLPALVYTMHEDGSTVRRALDRGASGYVTKRETSAVLLAAVAQVLQGERFISPRAAASLHGCAETPPDAPARSLSEREQQILALLARGETNLDIAATLQVSVRTVETYYSRMIDKLNLDGMKDLRKYAIQAKPRG